MTLKQFFLIHVGFVLILLSIIYLGWEITLMLLAGIVISFWMWLIFKAIRTLIEDYNKQAEWETEIECMESGEVYQPEKQEVIV